MQVEDTNTDPILYTIKKLSTIVFGE